MRHDPDRHRRRSIRPKGFDYSSVRAYFMTVCAQGRMGPFSELVDGKMHLSPAGEGGLEVWNPMPEHDPVGTDAFVVMPNHIHVAALIPGDYYERVIRDEDELRAIRAYIVHRDTDEENPYR